MQVFLQQFIPLPANYTKTTDGMRAVDPDVVASDPKGHIFVSLKESLI